MSDQSGAAEVAEFVRQHDTGRHGQLTLVCDVGTEKLALEIRTEIDRIYQKRNAGKNIRPPAVDIKSWNKYGYHSANGEPNEQMNQQHLAGHDVIVLTSGPGTPVMMLRLWLLLKYVLMRGAERVTVIFGYGPWSRSDKDQGTLVLKKNAWAMELFTSIFFGTGKLHRIIVVDPHADIPSSATAVVTGISVMELLFKKVGEDIKERLLLELAIRPAWANKPICILLPDDGAEKRYGHLIVSILKELGLEYRIALGKKRRNMFTDEVEKLKITEGREFLEGALVLMVDDELASGGTAKLTAAEATELFGAGEVWLVAVHAVLGEKAPKVLGDPNCLLRRIYFSDTIPFTPDRQAILDALGNRVIVVPWSKKAADVILRVHESRSVSELERHSMPP